MGYCLVAQLPFVVGTTYLDDTPELVIQKLNLVAGYIEAFVVRRSINFRKFASSSIRYTMYSLVKEIRNKDIGSLTTILSKKINDMDETWDGLANFRLHGQNRRFVKFLLSRVTAYIEQAAGIGTTFQTYYDNPGVKPFEVEHIWADKYKEHGDEFDQITDFDEYRNRIGSLVLLPNGTNQSYGAKPYPEKLPHYIKENLLVSSLCELTYQNNPNFIGLITSLNIPFQPHLEFKKNDIKIRQELYQKICEKIWGFDS